MPRVEIHMKISRKMSRLKVSQYTSRSSRLQEDGEAKRYSVVSTNPKTRRIRSLTIGKHIIGGALLPYVFSAQAQDDPEGWFLLGLTCALVVRKRRG
jgi:hypothetical protein